MNIIIPAYNEEKRIIPVIQEAKKYGTVIVVDDGSKDSTVELAEKENVKVLKHIINLGKGAALKTGCDYSKEDMVVLDADGQHDPKLIPKFIEALKEADIVYGYRVGFEKEMPWFKRMGNGGINLFMKLLYGTTIKDTQSGYRAFTKEAYEKIKWESTDYSMESEMIANAMKNKIKYKEIPISTIYHEKYKGTSIFDGITIVFNLFKWRLTK